MFRLYSRPSPGACDKPSMAKAKESKEVPEEGKDPLSFAEGILKEMSSEVLLKFF